ncbi:MAG: ABC transporter substrate-binding protein [Acetobacteraceae bacterium]|nr:ABC transporter substrate-binding protein [Acetobacteraceae bacterium]
MLFRRTALYVTAAFLTALAVPGARAQTPEQASAFVQNLGSRLVAIVNGPGSTEQKSAAMTRVIDSDVDVAGVGRFCLGRFWRVATPEQQREYGALFRKVLILSITSKIGDYQGVRFTMGRTTPRPEGQVVGTTIAGPKKSPAQVDWVVKEVNGSPKIVDVVAEGTSLRVTQRDDYASFLVQHNDSVQALIDALQRQASSA